MKTLLFSISLFFIAAVTANAQPCTPQGNETTYGTGNIWIGYVYDNSNLTVYKGYMNEGSASSPNFDESFGSSNGNFNTNGCPVNATTFSVRYKLTKTFAAGFYDFTVGGDDGYRLSLDGGATWVINRWNDQSYTTSIYTAQLNGSYNIVLEYYENNGDNRISFNVSQGCSSLDDTNLYGTNDVWRAYVYDGTSFNQYQGFVTRGTLNNPSIDENFGGSNVNFATSCTGVQTETFSVRFRLNKTFASGSYTFFVGGDDGYRLSFDGGTTWVINQWNDHPYSVSSYTATLNGSYNMVLEYYENGGENRVTFALASASPLPVKLMSFSGAALNKKAVLNWTLAAGSNPDYFEIERSADGVNFTTAGKLTVPSTTNVQADMNFSYTDATPLTGKSFYRLRITDLTGIVTYSKAVALTFNNDNNQSFSIYPTVVNGTGSLTIQSANTVKSATIVVTNAAGVQISQKGIGRLQAGQAVSFIPFTATVAKGMYIIRIADDNNILHTQKIIVQ